MGRVFDKMKTELLAPAGNFEKLKTALSYGADAVYLGGKEFSLRAFSDNFSGEEISFAVRYAHERGKKVYVCANIFARESDFLELERYFRLLEEIGADGVLVSDPGVMTLLRECAPTLPLHISTQMNTLNARAVRLWKELGACRVVLARELSIGEIKKIHEAVPDIELEAFVHGAMCISYSGRCLLSDYFTGRPSNRGACVQACRFRYRIASDEGKKGEWYEIEEDERGTYILNSKDLNLSRHLKELEEAGVSSFKIEGRMKSEYYLATVVNAYRRIMDGGEGEALFKELDLCARREYTTAYALGDNKNTEDYSGERGKDAKKFIAVVKGCDRGRVTVEMRNRFFEGDLLEILSPGEYFQKTVTVSNLKDGAGNLCADAKLVQGIYSFDCPYPLSEGDILRM